MVLNTRTAAQELMLQKKFTILQTRYWSVLIYCDSNDGNLYLGQKNYEPSHFSPARPSILYLMPSAFIR